VKDMKVERFLERLDKSREVDDVWRFLVDRFSRFRNVEVTGNAVHLVGPSGDSVATVIKSDGVELNIMLALLAESLIQLLRV